MKYFFLLSCVLLNISFVCAQSTSEHTVSSGETLQSIASKYGVSTAKLKAANPGLDDYIFTGMVLKLPSGQVGNDTNEQLDFPIDDLKDLIYLKDGSELVAKVLSVETNEIVFEQYDTDEPFLIKKDEVSSIKFEDGRVSDFSAQPVKKTTTSSTKRKSTSKKKKR